MSIDVQRVRTFNDELKKYNEKAAKNAAEIEFNNREIKRICDELTSELGIEVNPENISTIAEERIAKIEDTLQAGESILQRIKQEEEAEAGATDNGVQQMAVQNSVGNYANVEQGQQMYKAPVQQQAPVQQGQQMYQAPVQQMQTQQGYQVDQFQQTQQQSQQVPQGMPQMQGLGSVPNMGAFPAFQVGNRQQQSQAVPSQEIGDVNLFGSGAIEI